MRFDVISATIVVVVTISANVLGATTNSDKTTVDKTTVAPTPQPEANTSSVSNQCGRSNTASLITYRNQNEEKIKEDGVAQFSQFPWIVALLKISGKSTVWSQNDYLGGGTLIHPSVVMTVAHTLLMKKIKESQVKCRAGEWDTQTELETYKHQERNVHKLITHEGYYNRSLYNDIALLILEKPFQLDNSPHIGIGCLAPTLPPANRSCYSMGWGRTDPNDSKIFATVLKKVRLYPVEHDNCEKIMRGTIRMGPFFELHDSLTCAVGDGKFDACREDRGSPLVCAISDDPKETRFAVHGMVVSSIACFNATIPGIYANIAHLKNWVDDNMKQEGFDISTYTL